MNKLLKIRKYFGLTQKQLADILGVGQNNISQIENGITSFTDRNKYRLVEKLFVNLDWIENERGDIVCEKEVALSKLPQSKLPENAEKLIQASYSQAVKVPFYKVPISNGAIEQVFDIKLIKPDCEICIPFLEGVTFYRPISGNSMMPRFSSADIVACKREVASNTIRYGETYLCVAKMNSQIIEYLRVIRRHEDEKKVILRALNTDFDDIIINSDDIIELYIINGLISKTI